MSRLLVLSVGLAAAVDSLVPLLAAADPDTAPYFHQADLDQADHNQLDFAFGNHSSWRLVLDFGLDFAPVLEFELDWTVAA